MKRLLLLSSILVSCGKIESTSSGLYEKTKSLEPVIYSSGSTEQKRLKQICDALKYKTESLPSLANISQYVFSGTRKFCSDTEFAALPDSTVTLVNQLGQFQFIEGGTQFAFDVLTNNQGDMGRICNLVNSVGLQSPLSDSNQENFLYFTTTDISSGDCQNFNNEQCILIEQARKSVDDKGNPVGKIHTREWIRVRLDVPRKGFYSYRKILSLADCDSNQAFGRTATLK